MNAPGEVMDARDRDSGHGQRPVKFPQVAGRRRRASTMAVESARANAGDSGDPASKHSGLRPAWTLLW
jgi:hypothetical protein